MSQGTEVDELFNKLRVWFPEWFKMLEARQQRKIDKQREWRQNRRRKKNEYNCSTNNKPCR